MRLNTHRMQGEEARSPRSTTNILTGTGISLRDGHSRRFLALMHPTNIMDAEEVQVKGTSGGARALRVCPSEGEHGGEGTTRVKVSNVDVLQSPYRSVQNDFIRKTLSCVHFCFVALVFSCRVHIDMQEKTVSLLQRLL